jgi:hypothetical protein
MPRFTISGQQFELDSADVERAVSDRLPDPVQGHYVVVAGRRFPPKQVLSCATGLDRADFTTHHARRILKRLGFTAARAGAAGSAPDGAGAEVSEQAEALRPFIGQWVALDSPTDVLVAADTPQEILAWLSRHHRRAAYGMFKVPATVAEAEGAGPA